MNSDEIEIKGVRVGDKFRSGKYSTARVIDILEKRSLVTGAVVGHVCIARSDSSLPVADFETPFSTVARNRIQ